MAFPVRFKSNGIELVRKRTTITFEQEGIDPNLITQAVRDAGIACGLMEYALADPKDWQESLDSFLMRGKCPTCGNRIKEPNLDLKQILRQKLNEHNQQEA